MAGSDRYDGVLLSLAQQMQGGVPELFDVLFAFLARFVTYTLTFESSNVFRKTDFYSGAGLEEARGLVMKAFEKHGADAIAVCF